MRLGLQGRDHKLPCSVKETNAVWVSPEQETPPKEIKCLSQCCKGIKVGTFWFGVDKRRLVLVQLCKHLIKMYGLNV